MPYSDLIVRPEIDSITSTCTQAVIGDGTGVYDPGDPTENPGGYAPDGQSTATRPSEEEVQLWIVYRQSDATLGWIDTVPATQPDAEDIPFSTPISLLDGSGDPKPDGIYQVFLIVAPIGVSYATYYALYSADLIAFIEFAQANWAVGAVPLFANCDSVSCTNSSMMEANDIFPANCCLDDYKEKFALLQGVVSNLAVGGYYPILGSDSGYRYSAARVVLSELTDVCGENCSIC